MTITSAAAAVAAPEKGLSLPSNLKPVGEPTPVPGGKGRAVELKKGQYFKVTNTYGEQVSASSSSAPIRAVTGTSQCVDIVLSPASQGNGLIAVCKA